MAMKELLERKYSIEKLLLEAMGTEREVMAKALDNVDDKILKEVESGAFSWEDIIDLSTMINMN